MTDARRPCELPETQDAALSLSAAGRSRRDAILRAAADELLATHARRRRRRVIAAAAVWLIVIASTAIAAVAFNPRTPIGDRTRHITQSPHPEHPTELHEQPEAPAPSQHPAVRIVQVRTTPDAARSYAVHTPDVVDHIDDATLITLLASMDRPAGIMYIDGRAQLTRDVTDKPAGN